VVGVVSWTCFGGVISARGGGGGGGCMFKRSEDVSTSMQGNITHFVKAVDY